MLRCTFRWIVVFCRSSHVICDVPVASCSISSYKVKAAMLSDRLCPRTNSQFWGTNYDCLGNGCPLSGTYRLLPLAFSLLTLCSFVLFVSLHCAYCHLPIIFYFVPFFPCSDSEHDIVLWSSFTRSWPTYCQDLLSYDTSLVIDHLNFQCQLNAHRLGIVDYLNDILQVLLRRFRVIDVVWHN